MVVQCAVASVPKRIPCVLAKHKYIYVNTGMDMDSTTAVRIFVLALPIFSAQPVLGNVSVLADADCTLASSRS